MSCLLASPHKHHVCTVIYKDLDADKDGKELEKLIDKPLDECTVYDNSREAARNLLYAFRDLDRLENLNTLSLTFSPGYVPDRKSSSFELQEAILDGLVLASLKSFRREAPFLRPKVVILENLSVMNYHRLYFDVTLGHTEVLRLSILNDKITPRASSRPVSLRFWGSFLSHEILPHCLMLTSLTLHSDLPIGSSLELDDVFLPNLRSLDLRHIIFECESLPEDDAEPAPIGIDAFILRHGESLHALTLRKCTAKVHAFALEDPDGNDVILRQLLWSEVWRRYQERLTGLVELQVIPERLEGTYPDWAAFDVWYLAYWDEFIHIPREEVEGSEADEAALELLQEAVANRRARISQGYFPWPFNRTMRRIQYNSPTEALSTGSRTKIHTSHSPPGA
ncbi:hypothetical protein K488DRAFT_88452 [Vararia minispora EC-137]|uniref:Uncharacterized protein n=1 Tax=Vararia minispora EC-137 TaxID=1314806 RepID=A0ACB8QD47_9AGAM|nr:hypothetical protein K488DRAFT_88452 [Vararia minispora EC-137]